MHERMEELETQALKAQVQLAEQLEEVRRSFRAELVRSPQGKLELVRAADARSPFSALPHKPRPGGTDAA